MKKQNRSIAQFVGLAAAIVFTAVSTQAQAGAIVVSNFSFEDDVAPVGGIITSPPSSWAPFNQAGGQDIGSQNATSAMYSVNNPLAAPAEGNQFTYVNMFDPNVTGGLYQDVGALLPNTLYTLTVAIGSRGDRINSPGIISLINGFDFTGIVLAQGGGIPSLQNSWQDYTISFTTGSVVSDDLIISLSVLGNGATIQADFDNVRLDAVAVPEPSTLALGLFGSLATLHFIRRRK
jgi:hypothetical protein